jgi:predicted acetyltransferase
MTPTFDDGSAAAISLEDALASDRAALDNLMQLYAHDWSEILPLDVGADGRFAAYALDGYWREPWRHALTVRVDGRLAGFALVDGKSRLTGADGVFDMAEFFVLRRYRRQGVGTRAAKLAFDRFRGPWEVRERAEHPDATAFWRRAIGQYTGGRFEDIPWSDEIWRGPVQRFSTDPSTR